VPSTCPPLGCCGGCQADIPALQAPLPSGGMNCGAVAELIDLPMFSKGNGLISPIPGTASASRRKDSRCAPEQSLRDNIEKRNAGLIGTAERCAMFESRAARGCLHHWSLETERVPSQRTINGNGTGQVDGRNNWEVSPIYSNEVQSQDRCHLVLIVHTSDVSLQRAGDVGNRRAVAVTSEPLDRRGRRPTAYRQSDGTLLQA
jgi:hypothetical protein